MGRLERLKDCWRLRHRLQKYRIWKITVESLPEERQKAILADTKLALGITPALA